MFAIKEMIPMVSLRVTVIPIIAAVLTRKKSHATILAVAITIANTRRTQAHVGNHSISQAPTPSQHMIINTSIVIETEMGMGRWG